MKTYSAQAHQPIQMILINNGIKNKIKRKCPSAMGSRTLCIFLPLIHSHKFPNFFTDTTLPS